MKRYCFIGLVLFISLLLSCKMKSSYFVKPFFDLHNKYVGDSIFVNGAISKIIFKDTTYEIDSIVFYRYSDLPAVIKSIKTFKKGKNIFENIEFYKTGRIKKYSFIDEDDSNYYYERLYHESGVLVKINGKIFFQGFIIDTTSKGSVMKIGSQIEYRIFYPNPPDCKTRIYIKNDDGTCYDVFRKSEFLDYLQTVFSTNSELGNFKVTVALDQDDKSMDTTITYQKSLIFKVVP